MTGAKLGWWHGAEALTTLVAVDQRAQTLWGIGSKSALQGTGRAHAREIEVGVEVSEKGYTLIELLVTMIILSIVVAGLTTIFVSGSNAEAQLNNRFQAQLQARTALDKLRLDIHCASAAQAQTMNTYPSVKLAVGNCYAATPTISWCVVQVLASPPRYQLYRTTSSDERLPVS